MKRLAQVQGYNYDTYISSDSYDSIGIDDWDQEMNIFTTVFCILVVGFLILFCIMWNKESSEQVQGAPGASPSNLAFTNHPAYPQAPAFQNQMNFPSQTAAYPSQFAGQQTFQAPPPPPPPGFQPPPYG